MCGYIPIALNTHSLAICIMHAPLDAQISFPSFLFCEYNADTLTYECVEVVHTYKMRPTPPQTFHLIHAGDIVCVSECVLCVCRGDGAAQWTAAGESNGRQRRGWEVDRSDCVFERVCRSICHRPVASIGNAWKNPHFFLLLLLLLLLSSAMQIPLFISLDRFHGVGTFGKRKKKKKRSKGGKKRVDITEEPPPM